MAQTPAPTEPGSNVTPMWGGGFPPQRPWPQPPSCFSQLYALNQCYDDIIMMQQILQKVICDMAANNADFQKCLANAVAAAGAGMPIAGVTTGVAAQPGIVGEFLLGTATGAVAVGNNTFNIAPLTLPPGDWDVQAQAEVSVVCDGADFAPTFATNGNMGGWLFTNTTFSGLGVLSPVAQVNIAAPTLLTFGFQVNGAVSAGTYLFQVTARRMR